jgi:hypothetical protein
MTNTYLVTPQSNEASQDSFNLLVDTIAYDLECQANWQRLQDEMHYPSLPDLGNVHEGLDYE